MTFPSFEVDKVVEIELKPYENTDAFIDRICNELHLSAAMIKSIKVEIDTENPNGSVYLELLTNKDQLIRFIAKKAKATINYR